MGAETCWLALLARFGVAVLLTLLVLVASAAALGGGLTGSSLDRAWSRDPRVY